MSKGSILGPLTFNNCLIDSTFIIEDFDINNYAKGNTPYMTANKMDHVVESLEEASIKLFNWSSHNLRKGNADKCDALDSTKNTVKLRVEISDIKSSPCEKL